MVRLLAMGHAARGLGTGDFQGELDTRLVPKLCPGCQGVGALLAERCCPVVPVVCPRALVGAGAAPWPTAPGDHCLWCLLLLVFAAPWVDPATVAYARASPTTAARR